MSSILKRHWAPAAVGLACFLALGVVALIDGGVEHRASVAIAILLPSVCCILMLTPIRELTSRRRWIGAIGVMSAVGLLAISGVPLKLLRGPIVEAAAVQGEFIAVPPGFRRVRVELAATLTDKADAFARAVIVTGGETSEVLFKPRFLHVKARRQKTSHTLLREPVVEELRVLIPDGEGGLRLDKLEGDLEGALHVKVFAELLPPLVLLALSVMVLVGVGLLQRAVSLPKNATVAAGAALGFGHLVYAASAPEMLLRNALGAILGGLLLGALAGTLVRWLMVPEFRRAPARRVGSG